MNKSNINKILTVALIIYFSAFSFFHLLRLTFSWEIIIKGAFGEQIIPTYISGFCIIFSLIIILKLTKILSQNKKAKIEKIKVEDIKNN